MSRIIRDTLSAGDAVDLFFWPKILERRIVAGTFTVNSHGHRQKSPRWGVSMNHVARGSDTEADPTNWSLLGREELDIWFRRYPKEDAVGKPTPMRIAKDFDRT
jgi:hypothetical protein